MMNPFSVLTSKLLAGLSVALLLALAVQTWRVDSWRGQAKAEAKAHAQTIANYRAAQAEAHALAVAQKQALEARYSALQEKADANTQIALGDAQRRAADYVARNRVRPETAQGCPGQAAGTGEGAATESSDGQSGTPELVAVAADDVRICTDNTVRLEQVRAWALEVAQ